MIKRYIILTIVMICFLCSCGSIVIRDYTEKCIVTNNDKNVNVERVNRFFVLWYSEFRSNRIYTNPDNSEIIVIVDQETNTGPYLYRLSYLVQINFISSKVTVAIKNIQICDGISKCRKISTSTPQIYFKKEVSRFIDVFSQNLM